MLLEGQSRKMQADLGSPIQYFLRLGESSLGLNRFIGKDIQLTFLGKITCISCGRITKKSFAQGYCYPCMQSSPENAECIIRPELCRGHLGEGRDPVWEQENHVCEHVVYVAASSEMKVGVTRGTQVPTRFIDQGASHVRIFARTPHRCAAGEIEVAPAAIARARESMLLSSTTSARSRAFSLRRLSSAVRSAAARTP